jgi:hypothetical protein
MSTAAESEPLREEGERLVELGGGEHDLLVGDSSLGVGGAMLRGRGPA